MEYLEHNPDSQEEFDNIVNDTSVTKANHYFIPDVYDATYLSMELYIPRDEYGPDKIFEREVWVTNWKGHRISHLGHTHARGRIYRWAHVIFRIRGFVKVLICRR